MSFVLPTVTSSSSSSTWGPCGAAPQFEGKPYAPFNKIDTVTHIADWNASRYKNRESTKDGEDAFSVVDYGQQRKPKQFTRSRYGSQRAVRRYPTQVVVHDRHYAKQLASGHSRKRGGFKSWAGQKGGPPKSWNDLNKEKRLATSSVTVQPEWNVVDQTDFASLARLRCTVADADEIKEYGSVYALNRVVERANTSAPMPLQSSDRAHLTVSTTDDPVIQELALKGEDDVFATDKVLALLMTVPRVVDSFDIVIQKVGGLIFLDARRGSAADTLSVNESATEPPKAEDGINSPAALSREAMRINQQFALQSAALDSAALSLGADWPPAVDYANEHVNAAPGTPKLPAVAAYRYRRFKLGNLSLVVRGEVHAYVGPKELCVVHALNEFVAPNANDWRHKLDAQRGAVLAVELKNNSAKLARWTTAALLAGASQMRLGYVSRVRARDPNTHSILGTQLYKTADFAKQINLSLVNMWGIVQHFVDVVRARDNGCYVLLKDPSKNVLRLYAVPSGSFDDDDDATATPSKQAPPVAGSSSSK